MRLGLNTDINLDQILEPDRDRFELGWAEVGLGFTCLGIRIRDRRFFLV